jgi:hypothetical protein
MKRIAVLSCVLLAACSQSPPVARNNGVYLLLDTSGTYRAELNKAQDVILYTLSKLEPADSFAVARIDTGRPSMSARARRTRRSAYSPKR